MSASDLPDELWARILELGGASAVLVFRDLCCLAIASRRLRRLSLHPSLWSGFLSRDFPSQSQPSSSSSSQQQLDPKSLYKTKFERHKIRMAEARRRAVYEAEGRLLACRKRLAELEQSICAEGDRMKAAAQELDNLDRVSQVYKKELAQPSPANPEPHAAGCPHRDVVGLVRQRVWISPVVPIEMASAWSGSACGSHRRQESSPRMMLQDPFRLDLHAASYASPLFDVDLAVFSCRLSNVIS